MAILRKVLSSVGRAEIGKESFLDESFQIGSERDIRHGTLKVSLQLC